MNLRPHLHLAALWALCAPTTAFAYIGPGAGLGAMAVTASIVIGVLLLAVGLIWYPLKRLIKGSSKSPAEGSEPK